MTHKKWKDDELVECNFDLGERILKFRTAARLSIAELAVGLGENPSLVQKIESSAKILYFWFLKKIAEVLKVDVEIITSPIFESSCKFRVRTKYALAEYKYSSFLEYCDGCGYEFIDEITDVDFVDYKAKYGISSHLVQNLKTYVKRVNSGELKLQFSEAYQVYEEDNVLSTGNEPSVENIGEGCDYTTAEGTDFEVDNIYELDLSMPKQNFGDLIFDFLSGTVENIDYGELTAKYQQIAEKLSATVDVLGKDVVFEIYKNPQGFAPIIAALNLFNKESELLELYKAIPTYRREYKLRNYLLAFNKKIRDTLSGYFEENAKVSDIADVIVDICQNDNDNEQLIELMRLLQIDVKPIIETAISRISEKNEKPLML